METLGERGLPFINLDNTSVDICATKTYVMDESGWTNIMFSQPHPSHSNIILFSVRRKLDRVPERW